MKYRLKYTVKDRDFQDMAKFCEFVKEAWNSFYLYRIEKFAEQGPRKRQNFQYCYVYSDDLDALAYIVYAWTFKYDNVHRTYEYRFQLREFWSQRPDDLNGAINYEPKLKIDF